MRFSTALCAPLLFFSTFSVVGQSKRALTAPAIPSFPDRPKLVVGIVVDQMRYDYLYRYYEKFGNGGFRRLMDQGYNCRNNHYHYAATYTGPGHAAIYTGSSPAYNGIVGNDFYDRQQGRLVYCAEDTSARSVGNTSSAGRMSPRNMLTTTIGDQLKLATDGRAKVIGVALKDRGSILPAGHAADAAYWFDSKDGNWITSTFYRKDLPDWVRRYNDRRLPDQFIRQKWELLLPLDKYTESTTDDQPFEATLPGELKAIHPHEFVTVSGQSRYEVLRSTPFGDQLTKEFALAAIDGEQLGKDNITDLLAVSFSSTDYIGHAFGTHSVEIEDEYLKLDRQLAELFNEIDKKVGKGTWMAFLSADHGAADIPGFSQLYRIPADTKSYGEAGEAARTALTKAYGPGNWVLQYINQQIYLNTALFAEKKIAISEAYEIVRVALLAQRGVINVLNLHNLGNMALPENQLSMLRNIYHPNRSGDFYVMLQAGWFEGRNRGTTHGTMYPYDTHVPFLLYGWGIKPGQTFHRTQIADIAPTVCAILGILEPSGCVGNPVEDALK
ncbi:type I phosphodiesterase/nucleotide pyrophosphatase [Fibrella aestuarina BUZ 2]|uniref:Type I phosphodiesterase/nucleotide pyrophosphatase n=1 Tax=Fibrella aestuarina BUZ 2 TaxID=1166018 RepID=I0KBM2_9BACT|nr:alkaline phosphatase PafA [Fibrella aestuarina]CCH01525.1 type I phosphodiesterase/nucleotide pyrophosphatase [Fibrella aestuarina BUZ 2]